MDAVLPADREPTIDEARADRRWGGLVRFLDESAADPENDTDLPPVIGREA